MTPTYLCSATRSRGRAEQIGQDSQTSLLWLWSRSNSLPFPEALSAMTQGFHYHHNQRPPFHQPATQKVLLTGDAVCVCVCVLFCTWTHTCPCVCIRSTSWGEQKPKKTKGFKAMTDSHKSDHFEWWCADRPWLSSSCWPLLRWMKYGNFNSLSNPAHAPLLPRLETAKRPHTPRWRQATGALVHPLLFRSCSVDDGV